MTRVKGLVGKIGLTRAFLKLFNWFYFNFILLCWIDWELSSIICFDLRFIGLSWSYDPDLGG